jgi:xanthine/uracil permease
VPIIALLYNVKITERQFVCCSLISLAATIANEVLNKPVYQLKSVFIGTCVSLVIFLCCWLKNKIFYKIAN